MVTITENRPPGHPRSEDVDQAILDATLDLLIDSGIPGVSIEKVAHRAGVSRPTVYRRYPNRTELLLAAIAASRPIADTDLPEPTDVKQMLSWWARSLAGDTDTRQRQLLRRMTTSLHDFPDLREAYTKASIEPRTRWIRAVLEQERARGHFPADTDLTVVQRILSDAAASHLLTQPDDSTAQEIEDYLLAVLMETRYRQHDS
ncbi:TetR/AcrR family transcriptional regulator [Nonomuraea sp. NPDC046802]|uniref:TetR/AcrR family transcriptional regulator n=1 Tax=Nonomuraea sp. NPDC046802 TaxID=3154919 RepID=UPI0033F93CD1